MERTAGARRWTPIAASLAMFALLCATIAFWTLQWLAPTIPIAPAGSLAAGHDLPNLSAAARLFGLSAGSGGAPAAAVPSNIQVLGVAASELRGSAVLVVDGKPPRAFMVGDALGAHAKLVAVHSDAVIVERNGARVELPAPQRPSVATLWAGPARSDAATAGATTAPVSRSAVAPTAVAAPAAAPAGAAAAPPPAPGTSDVRAPAAAAVAASAPTPPGEPGAPRTTLPGQPGDTPAGQPTQPVGQAE